MIWGWGGGLLCVYIFFDTGEFFKGKRIHHHFGSINIAISIESIIIKTEFPRDTFLCDNDTCKQLHLLRHGMANLY